MIGIEKYVLKQRVKLEMINTDASFFEYQLQKGRETNRRVVGGTVRIYPTRYRAESVLQTDGATAAGATIASGRTTISNSTRRPSNEFSLR